MISKKLGIRLTSLHEVTLSRAPATVGSAQLQVGSSPLIFAHEGGGLSFFGGL